MNIFQKISSYFRREQPSSVFAPREGAVTITGASNPLAIATVYRCVNILADSVANLPMRYLQKKGSIFVEEESKLQYLLSVRPNPSMSAFDFWRQIVLHLIMQGNAYIIPMRNKMTDEIEALIPVVGVSQDIANDIYTVNDPDAGIVGKTFKETDIIHIKNYLSSNGKIGISTLEYARQNVNIAASGDVETLKRFRNGGNVRGLVGNDTSQRGFGEYADEALKGLAVDIEGQFGTGHNVVSLPGQAQWIPISMSSADMQFLEMRKFSVREICRMFGVNPSFVFDDTGNVYKSAEMANVAFLSNTLNPLLRKIENEFQGKLIPAAVSGQKKFEFDRRGLYACDLLNKAMYQEKTIAAGIYTVNEWRSMENQPPVAGGDTPMVSANLRSISEINTRQ